LRERGIELVALGRERWVMRLRIARGMITAAAR